jgi:hypothetical protein
MTAFLYQVSRCNHTPARIGVNSKIRGDALPAKTEGRGSIVVETSQGFRTLSVPVCGHRRNAMSKIQREYDRVERPFCEPLQAMDRGWIERTCAGLPAWRKWGYEPLIEFREGLQLLA